MTKQEWSEAKERVNRYQTLGYELDKVDSVLKNIKVYTSFTLNTSTSVGNANICINTEIRNALITLLQDYRDRIATEMENV